MNMRLAANEAVIDDLCGLIDALWRCDEYTDAPEEVDTLVSMVSDALVESGYMAEWRYGRQKGAREMSNMVEVVRCCECRRWMPATERCGWFAMGCWDEVEECDVLLFPETGADDFCSHGERGEPIFEVGKTYVSDGDGVREVGK